MSSLNNIYLAKLKRTSLDSHDNVCLYLQCYISVVAWIYASSLQAVCEIVGVWVIRYDLIANSIEIPCSILDMLLVLFYKLCLFPIKTYLFTSQMSFVPYRKCCLLIPNTVVAPDNIDVYDHFLC